MEVQSEYVLELLNKKKNIDNWILNDYKKKALIIYGNNGIGKTSLANYILRDFTTITINIDFCKQGKQLDDYLDLSLYKKSITMMFNNKNTNKAIIFDDINYIQSYDKSLFKDIISFSKKPVGNHHVIYIFNNIQNKYIQSIYKNTYPLHLTFTNPQMKDIVEKYYVIKKKINYDKLIQKSNYNFHNIKVNIDTYKDDFSQVQEYDKQEEELNLFIRRMYRSDIIDIYRICDSDYNIISLHLLQNCIQWIFDQKNLKYKQKISIIKNIYYSNCIGDNTLSFIHKFNDWLLLNHFITYSIVYPIHLMNLNKVQINELIYNKYVSKSIIYTYNIKLLSTHNLDINILSFLYQLIKEYNDVSNNNKYIYIHKIQEFINKYNIPIKIIEKFIKFFDMNKKDIRQLFKELMIK